VDLMRHADGELDEAAEREVTGALADDGTARDKVQAIGQLGELVRGHVELAAEAVPEARFAAMWREIDKATAPAPAPAPADDRVDDRAGVWTSVTRWLDRRLGYIITGVASAGAVAGLVLVFHSGEPGALPTAAGPPPVDPLPVVHRPAQIESLDAPGGTPTVLRLQDDDGDATVIWVTPDDVEGT
jgi:anti-sigma factor RsiW